MAARRGSKVVRAARPRPAQVLTMRRWFPAPREAVFRAFTDRKRLMKWWGPETYTVPLCRMNVRVGGAWRTCMRSPEGTDHCVSGVYRELAPPERLAFTWAWEEGGKRGHETLVTIVLREKEGGTQLALTQKAFESNKAREAHRWGWDSSLRDLAKLLGAA